MSRLTAKRSPRRVSALGVAVVWAVLSGGPAAAANAGVSVKLSPDRGLVNGQVVTVSGRGLTRPGTGSGVTWFVTQCTASVRQRMIPATDTPHCDVADAVALKVGRDGSFSTKFHVRAGIVGDGYCGVDGHATCVVAVATAKGMGAVVKIGFATPKSTNPS